MDWLKQSPDKPLFPDVIWSRPENKNGAGKLLIIGGSADNFAQVAGSYSQAEQAGVGTLFLLVPNVLEKFTKQTPFINYAPSNPSGSFARRALAEVLDLASRVDGVLLAGDLGKNSETSLMLEDFLDKYTGWIVISSDALNSFDCKYQDIVSREKTVICMNIRQLQKLFIELSSETAITSDMPKAKFAESLKTMNQKFSSLWIVTEEKTTWLAYNGNLSETTQSDFDPAKSAVWLIQQPEKPFQVLTTSLLKS